MTPPRRRGRRVPPKHGPRPAPPAFGESEPAASSDAAERVRAATRAQNRAAKRAASGIRPGQVRGRVRSRRGYSPAVLGLAIAGVLAVAGIVIVANPFGGGAASPSPGGTAAASLPVGSPVVYGDGTCPTSQPASLAAGETRTVTIETELGSIVVRIDGSLAPIATGNFVALVECEYYDGIGFHRTATMQDGVPFVIQGGDPDGTGAGPGPGYSIQDDPVTTTYRRGTVAMARTSQPNSQGSQFFIVLSDAAAGPLAAANTYAILGEVTSGMDVADAIYQASGGQESPADPVVMTRVTVSPEAPTATPSASPGTSPATSP